MQRGAPSRTEGQDLMGVFARGDTHGAAPNRVCVLVQESQGYGTKYVTISAAPAKHSGQPSEHVPGPCGCGSTS
jgi:hypothetical protein